MSEEESAKLRTADEMLEIRARERTFDGAYSRTALNAFCTGLIVVRLFSVEFFWCGLALLFLSALMFKIGLARKKKLVRDVECRESNFETSANFVVATAAITVAIYTTIFILVFMTNSTKK